MPSFEIALKCSIWYRIVKEEPTSYIERVYLLQNRGRRLRKENLDTGVMFCFLFWKGWKISKVHVVDGYRNIIWCSTPWFLLPIGFAEDL
jgi:hypothetical protein